MRRPLFVAALAILAATGCATASPPVTPATATTPASWIARSDANARVLVALEVEFAPERASTLGVEEADEKTVDLVRGLPRTAPRGAARRPARARGAESGGDRPARARGPRHPPARRRPADPRDRARRADDGPDLGRRPHDLQRRTRTARRPGGPGTARPRDGAPEALRGARPRCGAADRSRARGRRRAPLARRARAPRTHRRREVPRHHRDTARRRRKALPEIPADRPGRGSPCPLAAARRVRRLRAGLGPAARAGRLCAAPRRLRAAARARGSRHPAGQARGDGARAVRGHPDADAEGRGRRGRASVTFRAPTTATSFAS